MHRAHVAMASFILRHRRWLAILSLAALSACAPGAVTEHPAGGRDILIVTGEGAVPHYPNNAGAERLWITVAVRYANTLAGELRNNGHRVRLHVNQEKGKDIPAVVPHLLAGHSHNALIQVRVSHVKNATENTVYLVPTWLTLSYVRRPDGGRTARTTNQIERKEPMLRADGRDRRNDSFTVMAREFIEQLRARGAI